MTTMRRPRTVASVVAGLDIRGRAFIDGEYVDALSGETFDDISPVTGETIAQVAACDKADVDLAVQGCARGVRVRRLVAPRAEERKKSCSASRR